MSKKEKIRSQRGITLVSLVVTIIVLIILAGVSINLTLGENGIITMAKKARENMELAKEEEERQLNELYMQIEQEGTSEGTSGESSGGISYDAIAKLIEFKRTIAEAITNKGITTNETDTAQKMAENIGKIKTVIEDQTVIGPVAGGSYDNPYIPAGFRHFRGNGTWNDGYVIEEEATGNQFVWVPCVTNQNKVKSGDTVVTFGKKTDDTNYKSSSITITGEEGTTASEIEASVATYGGFYIARYEAGINGTTENYSLPTKTETNGSVKPLSKPGCGVWNSISRTSAITVSNAMIDTATTGAKSALISGACWDTTLQWIVNASDNKNNEPNLGYDTNSTGNGWYCSILNSTRHLTGYYAVNNIYDMAGNVFDLTTENCTINGLSYVVRRGGIYNVFGSSDPAAYRYYDNDNAYDSIGFRVVLYK